jgi:hypothetical protein
MGALWSSVGSTVLWWHLIIAFACSERRLTWVYWHDVHVRGRMIVWAIGDIVDDGDLRRQVADTRIKRVWRVASNGKLNPAPAVDGSVQGASKGVEWAPTSRVYVVASYSPYISQGLLLRIEMRRTCCRSLSRIIHVLQFSRETVWTDVDQRRTLAVPCAN